MNNLIIALVLLRVMTRRTLAENISSQIKTLPEDWVAVIAQKPEGQV